MQAAIDDAITTIRRFGKPAGTLATEPAAAQRYLDMGCQVVAVGLDSMLLDGVTSELAVRFKRSV